MAPCNASCQKCCVIKSQAPALFQSLTIARRDELSSLFRHNASAVDSISASSVVSGVQEDLNQCIKQIRQVEKEKIRLEGLLLSLHNQRQSLEGLRDDCKNLSAPIRRAPKEVLRNIFVLLEPKSTILGRTTTKVDAFELLAVSHHWRNVALSTKQLWTHIYINMDQMPIDPGAQLRVLDRVFNLSGQEPLKLKLYGKLREAVIDRLVPQLHRLSEASMGHYPILSQIPLPCLKDLSTSVSGLTHLPLLETAGQLRNLTLRVHRPQYLSRLSTKVFPPIPSLDTIRTRQIPLDIALHLLGHYANLTSFVIEFCFLSFVPGFSLPIKSSRSLKHLSIENSPRDILEDLFNQLDLPQLISFTVNEIYCETLPNGLPRVNLFPRTNFADMLLRTKPQLQSLTLKGIGIESEDDLDIITILELLPSLETLVLGEVTTPAAMEDSTLARMNANVERYTSTRSRLLLPKLTSLSLSLCEPALSTRPFVEMIQSRWVIVPMPSSHCSVAGLKKVHCFFDGFTFDQDELQPLRVMKSAGVDIKLSDDEGLVWLDLEEFEPSNPFTEPEEMDSDSE
ncbi:hypothetical protein C8J56DRAFT_1169086 [Mycena floridula]|nr:hypothetical protein C8J56DRAFT_1169086 [Mycena floridula]